MGQQINLKACPNCRVGLSLKAAGYEQKLIAIGPEGSWDIGKAICPACSQLILWLINTKRNSQHWLDFDL